jgi:hypothetical protein
MASATVRYWRGAWVVDVSTRIAGKRQRTIKTFGAGAKAKAAAQAYAAAKAPRAKSAKFWERRTATFAELWVRFAAHELASPDLRPSTVADYKAAGIVERQASRRGEEAATTTESSMRSIPLPAYLIQE